MSKIIFIRFPEHKAEIPFVISNIKYNKLKNGSFPVILKFTKEEQEKTKELISRNDNSGGSIFGTILSALPIVGDIFGAITGRGQGIKIENAGGKILPETMKKKIPTFSASLV